ncbi:DUF2956 family protein [Shewanella maritima]|uniref:DUF2956 family protein n=1 Tax=Shewanella maritima TaxID=2520507 RepID=UPI003734C834
MKKSANKTNISAETQQQAMAVAKATQKPGQTKEQTKLIAAGIEKGIAEYKKLQKSKARVRDKQRKQLQKQKLKQANETDAEHEFDNSYTEGQFTAVAKVLLALLLVSWGVIAYLLLA